MPNWIEGTLKLRGKRENIRNFIKNEITASELYGVKSDINEQVIDDSGDDYLDFTFKDEPWIEGTRRAFITNEYLWMEEDYGVAVLSIKQAWSFNSNDEDLDRWKEIARNYDIDIKLYGIECGMQFCHEIIITEKGSRVVENVIQYENWDWDCPFPNMGG